MTKKERPPIDAETTVAPSKFDPEKSYSYTWPGQKPKTVKGDELARLCKGADPEMLDIKEAEPAPVSPPSDAPASDVIVTPRSIVESFSTRPKS